jgi:4a-hydroxytetrahydrobiopterin dehydratase
MNATKTELNQKKCTPCHKNTPPLDHNEQRNLLEELNSDWRIERGHHLEKEYLFPDFRHALSFTNCIGELAECEGHHPDIFLAWGKVKIHIWTHKIDGLTENDFILAAKCDQERYKLLAERPCY